MGTAGFTSFADLGDLGIDMQIGEDLGMPPVNVGVERATDEMVAELLVSSDDSEETESDDEAATSAGSPGPSASELHAEAEHALAEEREVGRKVAEEGRAEQASAKVTVSYSAWEHLIDGLAGPAPTFNYEEYIREHSYVRPERTRQMFRRAVNTD